MKSRLFKLTRRNDGQAAVEFAFIFSIMLLLIMGIVEFGVLFGSWLVVTNAAREGARAAAISTIAELPDIGSPSIEERVMQATTGLIPANVSVTMEGTWEQRTALGLPTSGEPTKVTVTYDAPLVTTILSGLFPGGTITLGHVSTMRLE